MDDKIKKKLRSDYEELEIQPTADLWNQIDSKLQKEPEAILKPASSDHWWKYAAVILLLISTGTFIYLTHDFNTSKTDDIVKKNISREVSEIENNLQVIPQTQNVFEEKKKEIVKETGQKFNDDNLESKKETNQNHFSQPTKAKLIVHHDENSFQIQENIVNNSEPVITVKKQINYITANDLLIGRELDKSREKSQIDTKKFGVIHIDNVIPKVGNVTVLGVTVYIDPK